MGSERPPQQLGRLPAPRISGHYRTVIGSADLDRLLSKDAQREWDKLELSILVEQKKQLESSGRSTRRRRR